MPPKKANDDGPPLPRFGRVGNNLKMGIVGYVAYRRTVGLARTAKDND